MTAVQSPKAWPTEPTKTANQAELIPGVCGANARSSSEPIGQSEADIAHRIPRPRSECVTTSGTNTARTTLKNTEDNTQRMAISTSKIVWITDMNREIQNEIGRCQSS